VFYALFSDNIVDLLLSNTSAHAKTLNSKKEKKMQNPSEHTVKRIERTYTLLMTTAIIEIVILIVVLKKDHMARRQMLLHDWNASRARSFSLSPFLCLRSVSKWFLT